MESIIWSDFSDTKSETMGLFPKWGFMENHIRPQGIETACRLYSTYERAIFLHGDQDTHKKYEEKSDLCNTTGYARMKSAKDSKQAEIKSTSGEKLYSTYERAIFLHGGQDTHKKYEEKSDLCNTTGYASMKSTENRKQAEIKTKSGEKLIAMNQLQRFMLSCQDTYKKHEEKLDLCITKGYARIKSAEDSKQTENKTTRGEKLRYGPTRVQGFWDKLYSRNITAQASRIKSIKDEKQTEKKTRSRMKMTNTPSDEKEGEVRVEPSSRNTPETKSNKYPKPTKKKAPSKRLLNDVTPFIKWIRILIVFWGITMASATASTQFVATDPFQTFNVTKGTNAMIRFDNLECHPSAISYFTLTYTSEVQPFCCRSHAYDLINGGLRAHDQEGRFSVEGLLANDTFSVILNIINVTVQDGGRIKLVFILLNHIEDVYVTRTAMVNVSIPPPKAKCHFSRKAIIGHHYHVVRCHAPAENGKVTLDCFQANSKIIPIDIITDNNDMIRGTFLARFGDQVQCCSHLTTDIVTRETCDHSIFHHPKSITTPISKNLSLETTKSPVHLDSRHTTVIGSTNSSDQVCVFMPWIPLYLKVIILAYISLSSLMYSEFSLNRPYAI